MLMEETTTTTTTTTTTFSLVDKLIVRVRFVLGKKSANINTTVQIDPNENFEQLRKKVLRLVQHRKLLDDVSEFDTTIFGFTLPDSDEFIKDNVVLSSMTSKNGIEFLFKKRGKPNIDFDLTIISAINIPKMDSLIMGGKCDPYVVVKAPQQKGEYVTKTVVKPNTLEPTWNQCLTFKNVVLDKKIIVEMYDKDPGRSEFIGSCSLDITKHLDLREFTGKFILESKFSLEGRDISIKYKVLVTRTSDDIDLTQYQVASDADVSGKEETKEYENETNEIEPKKIMMEGKLEKKHKHSNQFSWNYFWIVNNYLNYDQKRISLDKCTVLSCENKNGFKLHTKNSNNSSKFRIYEFKAPSEKEKDKWIVALTENSSNKVGRGKIKVHIIEGRNLSTSETIGNGNLYCSVIVNKYDKQAKTTKSVKSGETEKWDETFTFTENDIVVKEEHWDNIVINVSVFSSNWRKKYEVGKVSILLKDIWEDTQQTKFYTLKECGDVQYQLQIKVNYHTPSYAKCFPHFTFGRSINEIPTKPVAPYKAEIPLILSKMKDYLLTKDGLMSEGIFRECPGAYDVHLVKLQLNKNSFKECKDVNCIARLIKVWFHDLPERMLDDAKILKLMTEPYELTVEGVAKILEVFPEPNKSIMEWLLDLCVDVCALENHNRMTPKAMAVVFAPNLLPKSNNRTPSANDLKLNKRTELFFEKAIEFRQKKPSTTTTTTEEKEIDDTKKPSTTTTTTEEKEIDDTKDQKLDVIGH